MGRKHSKLSVARVGRAERANEALDLRKCGLTFREIGARMGVTEQRAHALVTQELARLNAKRSEGAEAVTRLEVERLDALLAAVWPKAVKGDLAAVDRVLSILARRARLLGLDAERPAAPSVALQNVNVSVGSMTDDERAEAVAAILSRLGRGGARPPLDGPALAPRPLLGRSGEAVDGGGDDAGPLAGGDAPLFG
jgi:hypothetical protein